MTDDEHLSRIAALVSKFGSLPPRDAFFHIFSSEMTGLASDPEVESWYRANHEISMLNEPVLCAATVMGALAKGPVLEIGTYVGGTTVAIGRGTSVSQQHIVCLEKGGAHPSHPRLPSDDILADHASNVARFGITDRVRVVAGNYGDDKMISDAVALIGDAKVGLLCIDADGHVDRSLTLFSKYLAPDCIVIIDDYDAVLDTDKTTLTKPTVDLFCRKDYLRRWGVLAAETWLGELGPRHGEFVASGAFVSRILSRDESEAAHCPPFLTYVSAEFVPLSDDITNNRSPLLLLEDGRLLGPAHQSFDMIRSCFGSYVHWNGMIAFNTSDGTDPRTNGRTYELVMGNSRRRMLLA